MNCYANKAKGELCIDAVTERYLEYIPSKTASQVAVNANLRAAVRISACIAGSLRMPAILAAN